MNKELYDRFYYGTAPYDGVDYIKRESDGVFYAEDLLVIAAVPPTATGCDFTEAVAVGAGAFSGCAEFKSENLNIPNVCYVGAYGFMGCEKLTEVDLPDSVTTIEQEAFCNTCITRIRIPKKLTTLSNCVVGYSPLTELEIPCDSELEIIEAEAIAGTEVREIFLPSSVREIHEDAFEISPLEEIICNKGSFAERWATNHGYKVRCV